jgi:hypothetical protein
LAAALILALAAALIVNFFLAGLAALILAHLAFWAAAILALPAALIFRLFFGALAATGLAVEPANWFSFFSKASIFALRLMTWRNCLTDRSAIEFIQALRVLRPEKSSIRFQAMLDQNSIRLTERVWFPMLDTLPHAFQGVDQRKNKFPVGTMMVIVFTLLL